jgi:exopolysaccharide biosynthesis polyprenyl glycosylphosphotransferase
VGDHAPRQLPTPAWWGLADRRLGAVVTQLDKVAFQGAAQLVDDLTLGAPASVSRLTPPAREPSPSAPPTRIGRPRRIARSNIGSVLFALDVAVVAGFIAAAASARWVPAIFGTLLVALRAALRMYRPRLRLSWIDDLPRSFTSLVVAGGVTSSAAVLLRESPGTARGFVRTLVVVAVLNELARWACVAACRYRRRHRPLGHRTLIMGAGDVGQALGAVMVGSPELGLVAVGYIDPSPRATTVDSLRVLSRDPADLAALITEHQVDTVVVSFALTREAELLDAVITAHRHGCLVLIVPRMFEVYQDGPDVERIGGYPLLRLRPDPTTQPMWAVKRAIDRVLAATALVLLSPVLAVCAAAILLESGRPVLFHQTRVGLDGIPFRIHKLRTLKPENEEESQTRWSVAGDYRLGRVGKILRRTSIDEVPQLWNILRGELSFFGPRPERPGFVEIFSHEHARYWARHRVPVGLTGLAQINGLRGDTSIADRARFDNYDIANWSVWLDIKILALTVREVVHGSGS